MRATLWYLAFVGVPFLALFGILRIGEDLRPPRAVHGRYAVAFDSSGRGPCFAALVDTGQHSFTVAQSGPRLEIALGGLELAGAIAVDSVRATAVLADNAALRAAQCLTSDTLRLAAALDGAGTDMRLPGQFWFPGCAACPPVTFRATRVAGRSGETGR